MTVSGVPAAGNTADAASLSPVDDAGIQVLLKRTDFLQAAKSARRATPAFVVQARKRAQAESRLGVHVGYTCSKKVGNAVARNRAKRRLREIARMVLPVLGRDGWDYVLIGRAKTTATRPLDEMCADLKSALIALHRSAP